MRILNIAIALALLILGGWRSNVKPPLPADGRDVDIVGLDYAFQSPPKVVAGRTVFHFVNKGKVGHELNISLLKTGANVERFLAAVRADAPTGEFREGPVGVLFAGPGKRSGAGLSTDLVAGRTYVVICINRDEPKAKRHVEMGMYSVIVPAANPADASVAQRTSPSRVDSIVATEYSFRYPRTLAPGRHSIAFVNNGKFRHEALIALLKRGVTLEQLVKTDKAGGDVDALIDADFGVLHSPAQTSPLGRLEIDMLAGRDYAFICSFSNDDKSPPHIALGMFGSIHVTGTAPSR